ncbi:MAG: hypothetical protein P4L42_00840 [Desulfocapsaceae bacterium]|nr:hypothetical protein [Desulfocapsaceae bacterium]
MKTTTALLGSFLLFTGVTTSFILQAHAETVFSNPGIPHRESIELSDRIDSKTGYVIARVDISVHQEEREKYYLVNVAEGDLFINTIKLDYDTLTTISESRYDCKTGKVVESYHNNGQGGIRFFNQEKGIDKQFANSDKNIYSRYAYFLSFQGFPFEEGKSVTFASYVAEYGDALPMKVTCKGKKAVKVKAGTFNCYELELSVDGWQSLFASDKYYLYYAVDKPHQFIKYEEKDKNGQWYANELVRVID